MILKRGDVVRLKDSIRGKTFAVDRGTFGEIVREKDGIYDGYAKIIGYVNFIPLREEDVNVIPEGTYE